MNQTEHYYRERSRTLFQAAQSETDPELRTALHVQSERVGMKALHLQLQARAQLLMALGVSPRA